MNLATEVEEIVKSILKKWFWEILYTNSKILSKAKSAHYVGITY